jgi:uncharacterized membrane protein
MPVLVLYLATLIPFVALDALMLSRVVAPMFRSQLGAQVLESPRWLAAGAFYIGYVGLVCLIVGWPALKSGTAVQALLMGAALGAAAYGTYELTNMATLRDWSWKLVLSDGLWGTVLTGVSVWIGVSVARAIG